eukprot:SM000014S00237  [mRNA]  locus=s14:159055:160021:+ [translate_table: standard]
MLAPPSEEHMERQFLSFGNWCPSLTSLSILGSRSKSPSRINSKTLVEMLSNLSRLVGLELDGSKYSTDDTPLELESTDAPDLSDAWSSLKLDSVRSLSCQRMHAQHVHHLVSACSQSQALHVQGCPGIDSTVLLDHVLSTCPNICEIALGASYKFLGCRVPLTTFSRTCYLELFDSPWRLSTFFSPRDIQPFILLHLTLWISIMSIASMFPLLSAHMPLDKYQNSLDQQDIAASFINICILTFLKESDEAERKLEYEELMAMKETGLGPALLQRPTVIDALSIVIWR